MKGIKNKNKKLRMNMNITHIDFTVTESYEPNQANPIVANVKMRLADGFIDLDEESTDRIDELVSESDAEGMLNPIELKRISAFMLQIADAAIKQMHDMNCEAADHYANGGQVTDLNVAFSEGSETVEP